MNSMTQHRLPRCTLALLVAALCAGFGVGCERTMQDSPLEMEYEQADMDAELDFWHQLANREMVNNNEAIHGLIVFANDNDPNTSYDERVRWMKDQGYLRESFDATARASVRRGDLAEMLVRILDIEGGVIMRIFGPSPRYATRELVFMNILPESSDHQGISGIDYIGVIGKAEDYQRQHQSQAVSEIADDNT